MHSRERPISQIEEVRAKILRQVEAIERARQKRDAARAETEAAACERLTALLGE